MNLGLFVVAALVLLLTPGPAVLYIVTRSRSERWISGTMYLGLGLAATALSSNRK